MERRRFLKMMGIGLGSVGAASAFARPSAVVPSAGPVVADPHALPVEQEVDAAEMDRLHSEGVTAFLDNVGKDPGFWGRPLEPVMDGDVKVFNLVCQDIEWETMPGTKFPAYAYNGVIPGPEIRVTEGDNIRIVVKNEMVQSTAIHFHGMLVPNAVDGVPFITQPAIKNGETFTYEWTIRDAGGTYMYHSHHNAAEQTAGGLLGALIVEPKDTTGVPEHSAEYTFVLNDTSLGFTINGKGFPYTQPIVAKLGDKIRVRYMNEGFLIHPMHLHGIPQTVFMKDGHLLPQPYIVDTLNIAPGERYDVIVDCTEPGVWAYHCHVLTHAESRHGMYGMVTVLIVTE